MDSAKVLVWPMASLKQELTLLVACEMAAVLSYQFFTTLLNAYQSPKTVTMGLVVQPLAQIYPALLGRA